MILLGKTHPSPLCHHIWDDRPIPLDLALPLISFVLFEFSVFEIALLSWTRAQCWDYSTLSGFFALVLEIRFRFSSLCGKHVTNWAISPTQGWPPGVQQSLQSLGQKNCCMLIAPAPFKTCLDMSVVCSISAHWQVSWRTAAWSWRPSYSRLGIHNGTEDVKISYKQHC